MGATCHLDQAPVHLHCQRVGRGLPRQARFTLSTPLGSHVPKIAFAVSANGHMDLATTMWCPSCRPSCCSRPSPEQRCRARSQCLCECPRGLGYNDAVRIMSTQSWASMPCTLPRRLGVVWAETGRELVMAPGAVWLPSLLGGDSLAPAHTPAEFRNGSTHASWLPGWQRLVVTETSRSCNLCKAGA